MPLLSGNQELPSLSPSQPLISHPNGYFLSLPQARELQLLTDLNEPPDHWLRTGSGLSQAHGSSPSSPQILAASCSPAPTEAAATAGAGRESCAEHGGSQQLTETGYDVAEGVVRSAGVGTPANDPRPVGAAQLQLSRPVPSLPSPVSDDASQRDVSLAMPSDSSALVPRAPSDLAELSFASDAVSPPAYRPSADACVLEPTLNEDKIPPSFGKLVAAVPGDTLQQHADEAADILNPFSRFSFSGLPPISSLIAEAHPDAVGKVDIIGSSEVVKSLLEAPYSNGPLSLAVHRVDRTVLVDSLDIHRLYQDRPPTATKGAAYGSPYPPKQSAAPHDVPQPTAGDFAAPSSAAGMDLPAGLLGVMQEAVQAGSHHLAQRVLQPAKKDSKKARNRKLFSKFMAHSMVSGSEVGVDSSADADILSQLTSGPAGGELRGAYDAAVPADQQRGQFGDVPAARHAVPGVARSQLANTASSGGGGGGGGSGGSAAVAQGSAAAAAIVNPAPGSYSASAIAKWKAQHEELMSGNYEPELSTGAGGTARTPPSAKTPLAWPAAGAASSQDVRPGPGAAAARAAAAVGGADGERAGRGRPSGDGDGSAPSGRRADAVVKQYAPSVGDAGLDASLHGSLADNTAFSIQSQGGGGRALSAKREDAASPVQCSVPLKPRPVAVGSFGMVHPTSGVTSSSTIYNMGWQWPFKRHVEWVFKDLRMLLGTNMPIFGCGKYPAVSLKLVDVAQRIDVLTGIDYWLDNLMCGVPDLVMCFHLNGVVKGYDWHKTMDLPDLASSSFNPELISDVANNIYNFLYRTTAQEGHTYWLFKDRDEDLVRIYDLTAICFRKPGRSTADNPYTIPVAMLLYRTAKYWMVSQNSRMTISRMYDVFALLKNTVRLLQGDVTCPEVQVSALYLLSTICVNRHDTSIAAGSPLLLISEPKFEADEAGSSDLSPPASPLFDGGANLSDGDDGDDRRSEDGDDEPPTAGSRARLREDGRSRTRSFSSVNTIVQSIDVNVLLKGNYSKQDRNKHESPPLPQASKRIQKTIELIEEGLSLLNEWQGKVAQALSCFATDSNIVRPDGSGDGAGRPGSSGDVPGRSTIARGPLARHTSDCGKQACDGCAGSAHPVATPGTSIEQQLQLQQGSLAELLRQHSMPPQEGTASPMPKRKGKKKRSAAKKAAAALPSADEPRTASPCPPPPPDVAGNGGGGGGGEPRARDNVAVPRSAAAAAHAQPSDPSAAAHCSERSAADADAGESSALPERVSGEIVIDTARRSSLVAGGSGSGARRDDDLDDLPGVRASESEAGDAENTADDDLYIDLRLDWYGAVHEGICACVQPWYVHAAMLLCNQAGLALHGLASDSLGTGHAGRALRYLNTASACFLVGERLTKYLCAHRCQEAAKGTSFAANTVAVMALKVRALDELITEKNSSDPRLSFERHAEEYCARTCGDRLTSWLKLVLPNQSCFHPTVLTNDTDVLMKEIHDVCVRLIQAAKQQDIPDSLAKTCVRFAAQACCDIGVKELQKIHFFIVQACSAGKEDLRVFALNISAAKAIVASGELSSLKMATDAIESVGEHAQAVGYRLNMVNCLHVMAIVEYPTFFLRLWRQHRLLELADVRIRYAKALALLDAQAGLHEKNVLSFQLARTTDPELQSLVLFNNLFIQVVKAYFMLTHILQGAVPVDHEPVLKLLHSAEVKIKQASGLTDVYARAGQRLRLATCLIQLGHAALLLEMLKSEGGSHGQVPGRKKSSEFKQTKFQEELKCAFEYVEACEDLGIRSEIVRLKLEFIQLCISTSVDNVAYTYQLHCDVLKTLVTLIPALDLFLRSFAEGTTDGAMCLLQPLVGVDGRAVVSVFFALPHLRRKCQHGEEAGFACDMRSVATTLLDSLQKLVRLQMQCKQLPSSSPDWKVLYRRALMELRAADPGSNEDLPSYLRSLLSFLIDIQASLA